MEFKVGDKVRFIGTGCSPYGGKCNGWQLTEGKVYTIRNITDMHIGRNCNRSNCRLSARGVDIGTDYQGVDLIDEEGNFCNAEFQPIDKRWRRKTPKRTTSSLILPDRKEWLKVIGK